jgi:hypothetical protein
MDDFRRATGLSYRRFFRRLHAARLFDWYLEVGCREGKIFSEVRGKTIAVDPFFRIAGDVMGVKPALHLFQTTSDAFFAGGFLARSGIALSVTFLDGMHLFEFLLRDLINAEAASRPDGVILMHDCCPFSHAMCTRDLDALPKGAWTGDVWKLIPILKVWRPDLRVDVLDCQPTGLVVLSNLDPGSRVLADAYAEIVADWRDRDLAVYGLDRFNADFTFADAETFLRTTAIFDSLTLDPESQPLPVFASP